MQLLHSRAVPGPEFVGISLLLKGEVDRVSYRIGDPFLLPGPLSTVSHTTCVESVKELHQYLSCMATAAKGGKESSSSRLAATFFQEDEQKLTNNGNQNNQVYRPSKGHGIGLHYRIIRDRSIMSPLIRLVLNAYKMAGKPSKKFENDIFGVVVCVGIAGLPCSYVTSTLFYSITQRMDDSIEILTNNKLDNLAATRALLGTLLLTDDGDRLTNSMAEAASRTIVSQEELEFGSKDKGGKSRVLSKKKSQESISAGGDVESGINSADQARLMVERLAVLSVAESDTIFRKYEAKKEKTGEKSSKSRRRKTTRDADLDGFDFKGEKRRSTRKELGGGIGQKAAGSSSVRISDTSSVKSGGSSRSTLLRQPKNDTTSRSYGKQRTTSVPALLASSKDSGTRRSVDSRRASSAAHGIGRSVGSRRQLSQSTMGGGGVEWSFDGTANGNKNTFDSDSITSGGNTKTTASGTASVSSRGSRGRQQQQNHFDPFASNSNSMSIGDGTVSTASETIYSARKGGRGSYEDDQESASAMDSHFGANAFGDDPNEQMSIQHNQRSSRSLFSAGGSEGGPRVQVNVALNEDLTCFYKLSKMSSCAVEGVVQVCSPVVFFLCRQVNTTSWRHYDTQAFF